MGSEPRNNRAAQRRFGNLHRGPRYAAGHEEAAPRGLQEQLLERFRMLGTRSAHQQERADIPAGDSGVRAACSRHTERIRGLHCKKCSGKLFRMKEWTPDRNSHLQEGVRSFA